MWLSTRHCGKTSCVIEAGSFYTSPQDPSRPPFWLCPAEGAGLGGVRCWGEPPVWWFWAGGAWGRRAVVVSGLWDGTSLRGQGSVSSMPGGLRLWAVPRARGQAAISCCPPQPNDCLRRRWWGEAWRAERPCTKNNLEERHPAVGHTWSCFKTYVKPPGGMWRSAQQQEWPCGLPDNWGLTGLQPGPGHFVRRWADGRHFPVRLHPSIWLCRQYGFSLWA